MEREKTRTLEGDTVRRVDPTENLEQKAREQKKKQADKKLVDLYNKYQQAAQNYGEQSYQAEMLASLVNVVCQIKALNDQLEGMEYAFSTLDSSFELMDSIFEGIDEIMDKPYKTSMFQGFQNWLRAKKFEKNIKARMNQFSQRFKMIMNVSATMQNSVANIGESLNRSMQKIRKKNEKRQKRAQKSGEAPATIGLSGDSNAVLKTLGIKDESAESSASSAPAPKTSGGEDFGADVLQ